MWRSDVSPVAACLKELPQACFGSSLTQKRREFELQENNIINSKKPILLGGFEQCVSAKATQLTEFDTASHLQYEKTEDHEVDNKMYDYSHVDTLK